MITVRVVIHNYSEVEAVYVSDENYDIVVIQRNDYERGKCPLCGKKVDLNNDDLSCHYCGINWDRPEEGGIDNNELATRVLQGKYNRKEA